MRLYKLRSLFDNLLSGELVRQGTDCIICRPLSVSLGRNILNYAAFSPKSSSACPSSTFSSNSLSSNWIFVLEKPKTPSYCSNICSNPSFSRILTILLFPDRYKPFLSVCYLSTGSQEQPDNGAPMEKLTPHEHANIWRGRRTGRPPSPIS